MRNVFVYLLGLTIALWLGGLIALFIFVSTLFVNDRATAVLAAPQLFHSFDRYQLMVAGVAIVCAIGWRFYACSIVKKVMMGALLVAASLGVVEIAYIAPHLDGSRVVDHDTFQRYHAIARWAYEAAAALVMVAGGLYVRALQAERNTVYVTRPASAVGGGQTSSATAPA